MVTGRLRSISDSWMVSVPVQGCKAGAAHVACSFSQACSAPAAHKTHEHRRMEASSTSIHSACQCSGILSAARRRLQHHDGAGALGAAAEGARGRQPALRGHLLACQEPGGVLSGLGPLHCCRPLRQGKPRSPHCLEHGLILRLALFLLRRLLDTHPLCAEHT